MKMSSLNSEYKVCDKYRKKFSLVQFESNNLLLEQDSLDKTDSCNEINICSTGTGVQTLNESPQNVGELLKIIGEIKYTVR